MWPNPLQLIILAFLRFVLSLGFSSMSPSTTIWFALLPTFVFQHFVDSHRFFTTGYNHILHIFKETVFKALFTFLAKIHMYNVDRKVFLNSRERSRTLHRRKPGVTTRLQSVRDTSEPGDKCDANTTSVFVTYLSPDVTPTRCTCWRYYYHVTLFLKCTLPPAGHQEHLLTANFDSEVKCCKFRMNQRRDLQNLRWWDNIKGRSLTQRLRYILVCWDYMSSRRKTIDTQRWLVQDCNYN